MIDDNSPAAMSEYATIELRKQWFGVQETISNYMSHFADVDMEFIKSEMTHVMQVNLRAYVMEEVKPVAVKYPADWREAVKERFLPERLKRRFPVRYITVIIETKTVYPQIRAPQNYMQLYQIKEAWKI